MQLSERRDTRRLVTAVMAAILVHAGLFVAIPYLTSLDTSPLPDYGPVIIRVELPEATLEMAPPVVEAAPRPEPQPVPVAKAAPAPAPKPATKPAARTPAPATTAKPATAPLAAAPAAPTRSPGTSAFRQSGATTGTSAGTATASIVAAPPPVTLPAVGTTTPGGGEQRSGEAVSLTSKPGGGAVELGTLDKSLAGAATTGAATGASGAAPAAGSGTPAASSNASIAWKDPDDAKGRKAISVPDVAWPAWVKGSGQVLEVRIEFSVNAAGLVTSARVTQGSGYTDVDDACRKAMLKYGFTPSQGAANIQGEALFSTVLKR